MVRGRRKTLVKVAVAAALSAALCLGAVNIVDANQSKGKYLPGDFHQHTLYTDGSNPFMVVMEENANYGLEWWANSEHGGARNRDGEGVKWLDTNKYPVNPILGDNPEAGNMYRWQSLRDYVFPEILTTRALYPDKTIINGLEWNVPGHEHCSTAIYQFNDPLAPNAISEFEYRFDDNDKDTSRSGENSVLVGFGPLAKSNSSAVDAITAVKWMQTLYDQGLGDAWVVPAHIERARSYTVEDFRNWNNAGPDVAFGFEGAPGHQTSGDRGFSRGADGGGTYGGSGYYSALVGGLWDALLSEGRNWWNFASSDFHGHWTKGGSDFWPGEYQKNYTFIDIENPNKMQAVFDGVRSGNSFHVEGDLIDRLEFTAHGKGNAMAMMGQTLEVKPGTMVKLKIKVHDPANANYCPLDMDNPSLAQVGISQPLSQPVLDHIDLIAGEWAAKIDPNESTYKDPKNPTAKIMARFERHGGIDKNGYLTYVYKFKAEANKNLYFRLRGTNLPAGVPYETDESGNPLADSEANDNLYAPMNPAELETLVFKGVEIDTNSKLDEVAEAYADLWFYSNPIFIKVVE